MHRTSSNEHNVALIFCKDVDLNPSIIENDTSELSELLLGDAHPDNNSEEGASNVEAMKDEIRESMYIVKLLEMIETVLKYETHLFNPPELELLRQIQIASPMQQFIVARLVQRKRGKWHRVDQLLLSYQHDIVKYLDVSETDAPRQLAEALLRLCAKWGMGESRSFVPSGDKEVIDLTLDSDDDDETVTRSPNDNPAPASVPSTLVSSGSPTCETLGACCFAEGTESATPTQLLECLTLDELKSAAKRFKVAKTKQTRSELIKAILHSSSTQTVLPFAVVTKLSTKSLQKDRNDMRHFFPQLPTKNMPLQERRVRNLCNELFGACFRLHDKVFQVLHLVNLVYFRSTQYSEADSIMLSAILATAHKRNYPKYQYCRTADVFKTRVDVLRYMESLKLLGDIDVLLGEGPTGAKYDRLKAAQEVIELWKSIWDRWNSLVAYFKDKPPCERGLERFEDGHILTRIVYKAAHCFGILKDYGMELKLRAALIRQTRWRRGKRGGWYDRMALIYTRYMGGGDANLNKARDVVLEGLNDKLVHLGSRPKLLKRLRTLEKKLVIAPEEQYVGDIELKIATLTTIEGVRVFTPPFPTLHAGHTDITPVIKGTTPNIKTERDSSVALPAIDPKAQRTPWKGKSIWDGKEGDVNVETFALEYYATLGFKGFHSEGSIISTLFGLLFWDILFAPIPGAFETPYQSAPLDLFHDSFFSAREDLINARLTDLVNDHGAARRIIETVDERERKEETWCIGVRWDQFEREDLLEIVDCLGGHALATICRLLAEEYSYRGGGVPDLFVWNHDKRTCKFVEVKGPGDNLSETQRVWIDVLLGAGVDVEVCRVYEVGKTPLRGKKGKGKSRGRPGRTPKPKRKSSGSDEEQRPDPEHEEEEEVWSSSEDGDAVGPGRHTLQVNEAALDPGSPGELVQKFESLSPSLAAPEDKPPYHLPPVPSDTGLPGKRTSPETEHGPDQEDGPATKRGRTSDAASIPTFPKESASQPALGLPILKSPVLAHRLTPLMPAPILTPTKDKVKPEPSSPIFGLAEGRPSLIGGEGGDKPTQGTVIPETPPPSPRQRQPGGSTSRPGPSRSCKQWRDELKATPVRKREKGGISTPQTSSMVIVGPKRKRNESGAHTPPAQTCLPPITSANQKTGRPDSNGDSIVASRTPRKRTRTNERGGLAGSPKDWEKKWPDVFPKWVGDMVGGDSDGDYTPSQSQPESQ